MILIETNSCPSGQKSMPLLSDTEEYGGYRVVLETAFREVLEKADPTLGDLAVVYDKNKMETTAYASVLAEISKENVWCVEFSDEDEDPPVKWVDRVMHVRDENGGESRSGEFMGRESMIERDWIGFIIKQSKLSNS